MGFLNKAKSIFSKAAAVALTAAMLAAPMLQTETVSAAVDYSPNSGMKRNVMYYGDWSIWGGQGNFYPNMLPADKLTHLNFAFLDFNADGSLVYCDNDAAFGAPVGMNGVQWGGANAGVLNAMQDLRAENPNLRIGVSVGGWSKSGDFTAVAENPVIRQRFVENLCKFVEYTNMDFIDLDWEYPAAVRQPDYVDNLKDEGTPNAKPADKQNFIILLNDIRAALDIQGAELGKTYELSVAIPASIAQLDLSIDIEALFEVVDFANIMTYDLRGAWDSSSGHMTALYSNPMDPFKGRGLSIDESVNYLLDNGAIASKIVVGAAFYTRGWQQVNDDFGVPGLPGLFGSANLVTLAGYPKPAYGAYNEAPTVSGDGGNNSGVWSYRSLDKLKQKYPGLVEYWDDAAQAPYLYNASTGAFFTYDNVRSVTAKTNYVNEHNLGGIISWMASQDGVSATGMRDELTTAIKNGLFGTGPLPEYNISPTAISVEVTAVPYTDFAGSGLEITIRNTAALSESNLALAMAEKAAETIKTPTLYLKAAKGAPFSTGGYGSGTVTNVNGWCVMDLSTVYANKEIAPGKSITFKIKATGDIAIEDIITMELSQKIVPTGLEIGRQVVYGASSGSNRTPSISGAGSRTISIGTAFDAMAGVTASDPEDGDLTSSILVTGTVNVNAAGTYVLTYEVTDSEGAKATVTRTITVISNQPVNTLPVISGASSITIDAGDPFDAMAGVTAYDAEDGDLTSSILVTNTVNTAIAGTYTVTYSVTDSNGAAVSVSRTVTVKAEEPDEPIEPDLPEDPTAYDPTKIYVAGDEVTYNGNTYRAKWWITGMAPGESDAWELVGGSSGPIGTPEYSITATYNSGDLVTYNGNTYRAKWWTRGNVPGESDVWELVE